MDWVRRVEERLETLARRQEAADERMKRSFGHLMNVMASQRERIDKAFDEVKLALLEQEVVLCNYGQEALDGLRELRGDLELVRQNLEETVGVLADHEARLRKLEGEPPAA